MRPDMNSAKQFFWTIVVLGAGLLCMTERAFSEGVFSLAHVKPPTAQAWVSH